VRFTGTDVITYDLTPSGDGWRVDFTAVGTNAGDEGVILTGDAIDGGPAGSGADAMSITVLTATGTVLFNRDRDRVRRRRRDCALKVRLSRVLRRLMTESAGIPPEGDSPPSRRSQT
jgi:hypothetical protein